MTWAMDLRMRLYRTICAEDPRMCTCTQGWDQVCLAHLYMNISEGKKQELNKRCHRNDTEMTEHR